MEMDECSKQHQSGELDVDVTKTEGREQLQENGMNDSKDPSPDIPEINDSKDPIPDIPGINDSKDPSPDISQQTNPIVISLKTEEEDGDEKEIYCYPEASNFLSIELKVQRKPRVCRGKYKTKGLTVYECSMCSYTTTRKSHLEIHTRIHTGDKPYSCSQCTYAAAKKSDLTKHEKIHSGDKPFICNLCSFASVNRGDLIRHLRVHTGDKPYNCSQCSYTAALKFRLTEHMKTHTGERPYGCTECTYAAANRYDLSKHMRRHTKNNQPTLTFS